MKTIKNTLKKTALVLSTVGALSVPAKASESSSVEQQDSTVCIQIPELYLVDVTITHRNNGIKEKIQLKSTLYGNQGVDRKTGFSPQIQISENYADTLDFSANLQGGSTRISDPKAVTVSIVKPKGLEKLLQDKILSAQEYLDRINPFTERVSVLWRSTGFADTASFQHELSFKRPCPECPKDTVVLPQIVEIEKTSYIHDTITVTKLKRRPLEFTTRIDYSDIFSPMPSAGFRFPVTTRWSVGAELGYKELFSHAKPEVEEFSDPLTGFSARGMLEKSATRYATAVSIQASYQLSKMTAAVFGAGFLHNNNIGSEKVTEELLNKNGEVIARNTDTYHTKGKNYHALYHLGANLGSRVWRIEPRIGITQGKFTGGIGITYALE